jgi:predicted Zn-dependent protease with MMP-like domain/Flp pilus assembly protein TadD
MGREESYDDLLDQAWDALDEERAEAALALCDRALRLDAKAPDAYYVRGRALWDLQREEEAVKQFDRCLGLDGGYYEAMLAKAAAILDMGEDPEEAVALCDRALAADPDPEHEAWAYELKVDGLLVAGEAERALRAAERGLRAAPEHAPLHLRRGESLYGLARFREAEEAVEEAVRRAPDDAAAVHLRARVRQRLGRAEAADRDFRRAAKLSPEEYRVPIRLSAAEFDGVMREALREIPLPFRSHLDNVEVSAMEFPSEDAIREGLSPDVLGLYQGVTVHERDRGLLPDRIILFQRTLENVCGTREELRREIVLTVRHEVGHHFGLSEEELGRIEYGSRNGD